MEYLVISLKGYLALTVVPPFKSATVVFLSEGDDVKSSSVGEDFSPTTQPLVTRVYHLAYNSVIHQTISENETEHLSLTINSTQLITASDTNQ